MTESDPSSNLAVHRRRHVTGEATRSLLIEAAEELFAARGIDGVTIREIQVAAGQSNASVVNYHFGSKVGLVQALVRHRQAPLEAQRAAMTAHLQRNELSHDPRSVVWVVVRPLADSVQSGARYVAFLSRLSEDLKTPSTYWPSDPQEVWGGAKTEELVSGILTHLPARVRRGRSFQLFNSVLNLLGDHAGNRRTLSEMQLHNYVDGWVGLVTAPLSESTVDLLHD